MSIAYKDLWISFSGWIQIVLNKIMYFGSDLLMFGSIMNYIYYVNSLRLSDAYMRQ